MKNFSAKQNRSENPEKNTNQKKRVRRNVKVPLSWRLIALAACATIGVAIFAFGIHRGGVTLPIAEKDRDTIFFSFLFAVAIPCFLYAISSLVMVRVLQKKSSGEIGKEVAKEIAAVAAVAALDAVIGGSGSGSSGSSSDTKGGGGEFGGGGASGGY